MRCKCSISRSRRRGRSPSSARTSSSAVGSTCRPLGVRRGRRRRLPRSWFVSLMTALLAYPSPAKRGRVGERSEPGWGLLREPPPGSSLRSEPPSPFGGGIRVIPLRHLLVHVREHGGDRFRIHVGL